MKECSIFWIGTSKSGNHYIGVSFDSDGFLIRKFVQVTEAKASEVAVGEMIKVPLTALN